MNETKELLRRGGEGFAPREGIMDALIRRRDRKRRNQRIAAGVVGIAVFVAAIWIVTSGASSDRTQRPADEPSTVNPTDAAEDVVRGFIAAWGAFDPEAAMTYVADDANLRGLIDPQVPANKKGLSLMLALAEAVDYQETITWCNSVPLSSGTHVVCGYDFTTMDAVALGRGPFTGSTIAFVIRDGEIVNGSVTPNDDQYASQVRAPFAEWLAATYPRDFEVMYGSIPTRPAGFTHVHYRLTEESIRLFGLRTREYVETETAETPPPPALASGAPDVGHGMCSDGAKWRLELTHLGAHLGDWSKVRFEVHRSPVGDEWHIRLVPLGRVIADYFNGTRVASDSGVFVVQFRYRDLGQEWLKGKAVDRQTGQVCRVSSTPF